MAGKTKYAPGMILHGTKQLLSRAEGTDKHRSVLWYWKCLGCDKTYGPSRTNALMARKTTNCCRDRSGRNNPFWNGYEDLPALVVTRIKHGAEARGHDFALTPEYLWAVWVSQGGLCAYTKQPLEFKKTASLDRIDSSRGYVFGNVEWVHKDVNLAKQSLTKEAFIELCKLVAANEYVAGRL